MKPLLRILCNVLLLLSAGTTLYAETTVNFHAQVLIAGEQVTLGEIAVISPQSSESFALSQTLISSSPAPGKSKTLQAPSIIASLRHEPAAAGVRWEGAAQIKVERKAVIIKQDQLINILAEYLASNSDKLPKGDIRFTSIRTPSEVVLPSGEITWRITPSRPTLADSTSFSIFFKVNNKPSVNCTVRGRVEVIAPVAVMTETVRRGQIILPGQIKLVRKDLISIEHPVLSLSEAVGMQAAKTLGSGKVVEQDHLTSPPVIESGELVKIIAGRGNLRISTKGVARTAGLIGDTIRVKNLSSNKLIHARVDGPGTVSVEF